MAHRRQLPLVVVLEQEIYSKLSHDLLLYIGSAAIVDPTGTTVLLYKHYYRYGSF